MALCQVWTCLQARISILHHIVRHWIFYFLLAVIVGIDCERDKLNKKIRSHHLSVDFIMTIYSSIAWPIKWTIWSFDLIAMWTLQAQIAGSKSYSRCRKAPAVCRIFWNSGGTNFSYLALCISQTFSANLPNFGFLLLLLRGNHTPWQENTINHQKTRLCFPILCFHSLNIEDERQMPTNPQKLGENPSRYSTSLIQWLLKLAFLSSGPLYKN